MSFSASNPTAKVEFEEEKSATPSKLADEVKATKLWSSKFEAGSFGAQNLILKNEEKDSSLTSVTLRYNREGRGDRDGYVISFLFSEDAMKEIQRIQQALFKEKMAILGNSIDFVHNRAEINLYYGRFDDAKLLVQVLIEYMANLFATNKVEAKIVASLRTAMHNLKTTQELGEGLKSFNTYSRAITPLERADLFSDVSSSNPGLTSLNLWPGNSSFGLSNPYNRGAGRFGMFGNFGLSESDFSHESRKFRFY